MDKYLNNFSNNNNKNKFTRLKILEIKIFTKIKFLLQFNIQLNNNLKINKKLQT